MYNIDIEISEAQANKLARGLPVQLKAFQVAGKKHSIVVDEDTAVKHSKALVAGKGMRIRLSDPMHVEASLTHGRGFKSMMKKVGRLLKPHLKTMGHALLKQGGAHLKDVSSQLAQQYGLTNDANDLAHYGIGQLEDYGHSKLEGMGIGRFFKKVGRTLKPVGKVLAPVAKQVGQQLLSQGIPIATNMLLGAAMGGGVKKRRTRGRGIGQFFKGVGKVLKPVGQQVGNQLLEQGIPLATQLLLTGAMGGAVGSKHRYRVHLTGGAPYGLAPKKGSVEMQQKMKALRAMRRPSGSGLMPAGY